MSPNRSYRTIYAIAIAVSLQVFGFQLNLTAASSGPVDEPPDPTPAEPAPTTAAAIAATNSWLPEADGNWDAPGNWSRGVAPAPGDTVLINPATDVTVTGPAGAATIGLLELANASTADTSLMLTSPGEIHIDDTLTILNGGAFHAGPDATFTVGGDTILDGGELRYTTNTTAHWDPSSAIHVTDGGGLVISKDALSTVELPPGTTITAEHAGSLIQLTSADGTGRINIPDTTAVHILAGASIVSPDLLTLTGGHLRVAGGGSTLTAGTLAVDPSSSDELSTIELLDGAAANVTGSLDMAAASPPGALYRSALTVSSGAALSIGGDINLGTAPQPGQVGTVASMTVGGGGASSALTQGAAGSVTVGTSADGRSTIEISAGGTFTTGAGDVTVNPTGQVEVTGGTLDANGPVRLDGGSLTVSGGSVTTPTLDINPPTGVPAPVFTHTGGTVTIEGGGFDRGVSTPYTVDGAGDPHLVLRGVALSVGAGNRMDVGFTQQGTLTVSDGGFAFGGFTSVGRQAGSVGVLTVDGVSEGGGIGVEGTASRLVTTTMIVGSVGTGTLNITNGGLSDGDSVLGTNVLLGSSSGSVGTANVVGTDGTPGPGVKRSTWDIDIGMTVASRGTATLNIRDGALVRVDGTAAVASNTGPAGTGDGTVIVEGTDGNGVKAQWSIGADLYVGGRQSGPGGTGVAHINTGGAADVAGELKIWPDGTVNLAGGALRTTSLVLAGGAFNMTDGTLTTDEVDGSLVQDGGVLSLGGSAGVTGIDGDYTVNGGGVRIEVKPTASAGPEPGVDHDQVAVSGNVVLGGVLQVLPFPDAEALGDTSLGTEYVVLTYGSRAGGTMFHTIDGTLLATGFALAPLFSDTDTVPDGEDDALILRATVPGDLNLDDMVSVADLSEFALNFNTTPGFYNELTGENSWELGDFNADGAITVADLSLLALNFGSGTEAAGTSVGISLAEAAAMLGLDHRMLPEPGSVTFAVIGVFTSIYFARRCGVAVT